MSVSVRMALTGITRPQISHPAHIFVNKDINKKLGKWHSVRAMRRSDRDATHFSISKWCYNSIYRIFWSASSAVFVPSIWRERFQLTRMLRWHFWCALLFYAFFFVSCHNSTPANTVCARSYPVHTRNPPNRRPTRKKKFTFMCESAKTGQTSSSAGQTGWVRKHWKRRVHTANVGTKNHTFFCPALRVGIYFNARWQ